MDTVQPASVSRRDYVKVIAVHAGTKHALGSSIGFKLHHATLETVKG
jgi:hypothetical protein